MRLPLAVRASPEAGRQRNAFDLASKHAPACQTSVTRRPPSIRQTGLEIPIDETFKNLMLERLCIRPLVRGKVGMYDKELRGFHFSLLHAAKLREAGG